MVEIVSGQLDPVTPSSIIDELGLICVDDGKLIERLMHHVLDGRRKYVAISFTSHVGTSSVKNSLFGAVRSMERISSDVVS